jgi:hypothetical protein
MILPEVFLEDGDRAARLDSIRSAMDSYLGDGVFAPPARGLVYIERRTPRHPLRRGLVLAVDLERYRLQPEARPLIRATEGTVRERIPPRMEIRRSAPLETPHVLLLIDDDERTLIEGLGERAKSRAPPTPPRSCWAPEPFPAGSWTLRRTSSSFADGLERLAQKARTRYGAETAGADPSCTPWGTETIPGHGEGGLGRVQGGPSVGTWAHGAPRPLGPGGGREHLRRRDRIRADPPGSVRSGPEDVLAALSALPGCTERTVGGAAELSRLVADAAAGKTRFGIVSGARSVLVETDARGLSTDVLQPILDAIVSARPGGPSITCTGRTKPSASAPAPERSASCSRPSAKPTSSPPSPDPVPCPARASPWRGRGKTLLS